ncbi:MAG TPA: acyl-CoA reductase [Verrucomicrobiae bacterium]|nr:acyl-CoA reductase [Verrucomicrobiae bacterium]
MNLPNYFLADLPPEATLSPAMISEACQTLKHNRENYLANRSTQSLVNFLSEIAESWLDEEFSFRKFALENSKTIGFSPATLQKGLDNFFKQFTRENFHALLVQEFGDAKRLDAICSTAAEEKFSRAAIARAPEFQVHIGAGNIPNPTLTSIIFGLLLRSAQFVKCASGASFLPRLFAHSIYDADPKLGACLEIAEWRGGNHNLEESLFAEADCVTATGSDETLEKIRKQLPLKTKFLGYGHRVSFGFVAHEVLHGARAKKIVSAAADDVIAWNQLGCLSPHVIYVQLGGEVSPEHFAQLLAEELERREASEPRGEIFTEESAVIAHRRGIYEVRAAHSPELTRHFCSKDSTSWTVIYEVDARFQLSCLNRFIYVKPVADLKTALENADGVRGKVSTVGIAAPEEKNSEIAIQLARWGATRICPLGQMQNPPLAWRHDGRPALSDLVTWVDFEQNV